MSSIEGDHRFALSLGILLLFVPIVGAASYLLLRSDPAGVDVQSVLMAVVGLLGAAVGSVTTGYFLSKRA